MATDDRPDPNELPLHREREILADLSTKLTGRVPVQDPTNPADLEEPPITSEGVKQPTLNTEKTHDMQAAPNIANLYPAVALKKDYRRR